MIKKANTSNLEVVVELKIKMFEDAGLKDFLPNNSYDQILSSYSELYRKEKAQHFIIINNGRIVACSRAFLKNDLPYCFYKQPVYQAERVSPLVDIGTVILENSSLTQIQRGARL